MERLILPEKTKLQNPTDADLIKKGFLAEGQTLEKVRARDEEALQILRCNNKELAEMVRYLYSDWSIKKSNQFSHHTPYGRDISVTAEVSRGLKPCPWEAKRPNLKENPSNVDFHLTYKNRTIIICGLLAHLIEEHGFYEGCPPYRVAPEDIVEFLGTEKLPGSIERAKKLQL